MAATICSLGGCVLSSPPAYDTPDMDPSRHSRSRRSTSTLSAQSSDVRVRRDPNIMDAVGPSSPIRTCAKRRLQCADNQNLTHSRRSQHLSGVILKIYGTHIQNLCHSQRFYRAIGVLRPMTLAIHSGNLRRMKPVVHSATLRAV
jgi:hypothetical protein